MIKNSENSLSYKVFDNVLSKTECQKLIKKATENGFEISPVYFVNEKKYQIKEKSRKSTFTRLQDSNNFLDLVKQRLTDICKSDKDNCNKLDNLFMANSGFRIIKYDNGGFFKVHKDAVKTVEKEGNIYKGIYNMIIYLNDDYKEGCTNFMDFKNKKFYPIKGKTGDVLIFDPRTYHEGDIVEGIKYILVSQIFRKVNL